MSIFTRYVRWSYDHPEVIASQDVNEIIRLATPYVSGLSLANMCKYAYERLWNVPENQSIQVKGIRKPIVFLNKGKILFLNEDTSIGVKKRQAKHSNLKAYSMRGCINRWRDACANIEAGDCLADICKNFMLLERKLPASQQISEFDRFALSVQTDCGNIADHDDADIDWITCTVTLGTQYGNETPAVIKRFKKDIDHRVIESVRANTRIANCDLSQYYLKSTSLWSGYHLMYTFYKKKNLCASPVTR